MDKKIENYKNVNISNYDYTNVEDITRDVIYCDEYSRTDCMDIINLFVDGEFIVTSYREKICPHSTDVGYCEPHVYLTNYGRIIMYTYFDKTSFVQHANGYKKIQIYAGNYWISPKYIQIINMLTQEKNGYNTIDPKYIEISNIFTHAYDHESRDNDKYDRASIIDSSKRARKRLQKIIEHIKLFEFKNDEMELRAAIIGNLDKKFESRNARDKMLNLIDNCMIDDLKIELLGLENKKALIDADIAIETLEVVEKLNGILFEQKMLQLFNEN